MGHMEFALNLAWLLLATTSVAILGTRVFRVDGSKRLEVSQWRFVVALGLSLVILFFVISMTDDLNEQQAIAEESGSSQVLLKATSAPSHGKHSTGPDFSHASLTDKLRHSVTNSCFGYVEELRVSESSDVQRISLAVRAPPSPQSV
jgi:hypothetical protein